MGILEVTPVSDEGRPVVSVCIANYNGESLLDECIGSVLAQVDAPTFEIIVHDDASADESLAVLGRYPDVHVIQSASNVGFCISNNRMAEVATGRFLLLLNNDAALLPDALRALFDESLKREHSAVLGMRQYDAFDGSLVDRGAALDWTMSPVPITETGPSPAVVIGACMWIPRPIWNLVGDLPAFFQTNAEDVYLCCAAKVLGYDIAVATTSGFRHRVGASLGAGRTTTSGHIVLSRRRRYLSERNRLMVSWIFLPRWQLLVTWPLNWAMLLIEALIMALRSRDAGLLVDPYLRSQVDALRLLGEAESLRQMLTSRAPRKGKRVGPIVLIPAKLRLLLRHGLPII